MTKIQNAYNSFMAFLGDVANAAAVVGAIQAGRQPDPEHLRQYRPQLIPPTRWRARPAGAAGQDFRPSPPGGGA